MTDPSLDDLRVRMSALTELAKELFEQQFIRCGGRRPADPTWDDLPQSGRVEWLGRAQDVEPLLAAKDAEIARLQRDMDIRDEGMDREAVRLKSERDAAESSRRDWAAEAMRLEVDLECHRELLHAIWLYVDWRKVTRKLTTEQKDMWADAIEATSEIYHPADADRWWRDPGFSRPVCAVHEEGK